MPLEIHSPSDNEINKVDISCYSEYGNAVDPPKNFYIANPEPVKRCTASAKEPCESNECKNCSHFK